MGVQSSWRFQSLSTAMHWAISEDVKNVSTIASRYWDGMRGHNSSITLEIPISFYGITLIEKHQHIKLPL